MAYYDFDDVGIENWLGLYRPSDQGSELTLGFIFTLCLIRRFDLGDTHRAHGCCLNTLLHDYFNYFYRLWLRVIFWAQYLAYVSFIGMLVIIIIIYELLLIHCSYFWPDARLNQ